ncbi:hypothetical protein CAOG_03708 [Capsaspora owczarzaki ATCC 30864]|uniref:Uncharacterized protein n=1 Tax=Capsaspora owczarzaki (strain ATCC 30864) TaxID=595528 RepID=A0A0D2WPV2_CAPO3|nr:hypothetical protein CAOG_03708 [Capsaspora owczarzaki ATCC 30864]KJE92808.1 hypothetical protein CAOG_003708 [Capsaspora owczarzaki ATCC 30864]|eukprot:XP_004363436.1 hypothetical protein CAOG_03708 [Capsaspora owczarzaki ATCC 30864]
MSQNQARKSPAISAPAPQIADPAVWQLRVAILRGSKPSDADRMIDIRVPVADPSQPLLFSALREALENDRPVEAKYRESPIFKFYNTATNTWYEDEEPVVAKVVHTFAGFRGAGVTKQKTKPKISSWRKLHLAAERRAQQALKAKQTLPEAQPPPPPAEAEAEASPAVVEAPLRPEPVV